MEGGGGDETNRNYYSARKPSRKSGGRCVLGGDPAASSAAAVLLVATFPLWDFRPLAQLTLSLGTQCHGTHYIGRTHPVGTKSGPEVEDKLLQMNGQDIQPNRKGGSRRSRTYIASWNEW